MGVRLQLKLAALLLWLNAAGVGLPCLQAIGALCRRLRNLDHPRSKSRTPISMGGT